MKNQLNEDFIKTLGDILPENINLASFLMEVLGIGKEAAYRRLRNEVHFSFHEVALIAKKIGLSVDQFLGNYNNRSALFNLNMLHTENAMADYQETLSRYLRYLKLIKNDPDTVVSIVSNNLPFTSYASYKYINNFRICRWLHQSENIKDIKGLDDIFIPEHIIDLQRNITEILKEIPLTNMIWDNNLFLSLINDIKYFQNLRYITASDVSELKQELSELVDFYEKVASTGNYENGKKVNIYLSNINFEASYSFLEKNEFQVSLIRLYYVNSMDSLHPEICKIQKEWIQSLKRYSMLISQSGEMQRVNFFSQQREYIDTL